MDNGVGRGNGKDNDGSVNSGERISLVGMNEFCYCLLILKVTVIKIP